MAAQPAAGSEHARREDRRDAAGRAPRAADDAPAPGRAGQARGWRSPGSTTSSTPASRWSCSRATSRSSARSCAGFPDALHLLGEDSIAAREQAIAAFQRDGGPQLIVCATRVAAQGITLTRASNVAFLELEWTPAIHDQAEDRCHRIGQRDAVTAWYLLAAETIDETMARLIQRKREVVERRHRRASATRRRTGRRRRPRAPGRQAVPPPAGSRGKSGDLSRASEVVQPCRPGRSRAVLRRLDRPLGPRRQRSSIRRSSSTRRSQTRTHGRRGLVGACVEATARSARLPRWTKSSTASGVHCEQSRRRSGRDQCANAHTAQPTATVTMAASNISASFQGAASSLTGQSTHEVSLRAGTRVHTPSTPLRRPPARSPHILLCVPCSRR